MGGTPEAKCCGFNYNSHEEREAERSGTQREDTERTHSENPSKEYEIITSVK